MFTQYLQSRKIQKSAVFTLPTLTPKRTFLIHNGFIIFNIILGLFNELFLPFCPLVTYAEQKEVIFASQKREEKGEKLGHLYRHCTSAVLSSCVTRSVNNSRQVIQIPVNKS